MLFDIENLTHEYSDGTLALDNVSVGFKRSERIALLGTNGSGKTTLLNHLNGILKPTSGRNPIRRKPTQIRRQIPLRTPQTSRLRISGPKRPTLCTHSQTRRCVWATELGV